MRTTLDLDDEVLRAVKDIARLRGESVSRTVSHLIRRGLAPGAPPKTETRDGVPVLIHEAIPLPVTPELVRQIMDSED